MHVSRFSPVVALLVVVAALAAVALPPDAGAYEQRFNCGGPTYFDSHGHVFDADRDYTPANGAGRVDGAVTSYALTTYKPIGGTADPELYEIAAYQWAEYRFDLPNGDYLLRLHFAEFLAHGAGLRALDVSVEGIPLLVDYDVAAEAGDVHYAVTPALGITVSDGQLNVTGDETDIDLFLSAIEVVSWPAETDPPTAPTGLVVWPSYSRVSLDWDDNVETDIAGYAIERAYVSGGPYTPLNAEPIPSSRFHDTNVGTGVDYFYRVSAVDIWGNQGPPSVEEGGYVREDDSSSLPVYTIEIDPADYQALLADPLSNEYKPAIFAYDGQTWQNVGVRFRGRFSRTLPKKSWKVKFNEFVPGQRFLDDQEELNLNAHHGERTLLREALAWKVNEAVGVPASNAQHAHLQVNGTYMGVFTEAEQVDERWLERHGFNSSGNLYKAKLDTACMQTFADSLTYTLYYDKQTNQEEGYDDLIQLLELIDATAPEDIYHTLAPIFDIESLIEFYAAQIALGNDSFFCHNYYLYHDLENDKWHYLPWDLDSTFGHLGAYHEEVFYSRTALHGNAVPPQGSALIHKLNHGVVPPTNPGFRRRYLERTLEILDEIMAPAVFDTQVDSSHALMIDDARLDWHKWGWEDPAWVDDGNEKVKEFSPLRTGYINSVAPLFMLPQDLFLNEIMADNDTGLQDEAGDYDDWFELVNVGAEPIALNGHYLTDDITLSRKWAMPDTVILAGQHLIFWADNEPHEGPTHTNFKLDYDGEFLGLFGPDGDGNPPIDTKSWGYQYRDVSFGRLPDGGYNWTLMPTPTPGASNTDAGNFPPVVGPTDHQPRVVEIGEPVTVTTEAADADGIASVTLYYKLGEAPGFESVAMADDGQSGDGEAGDGEAGDDVWGGEIPGQSEAGIVYYYVTAIDSLGASASDPRNAPTTTFSFEVGFQAPPLFVNEFMALNESFEPDEFGEFDDWLEVYNASDQLISLAGLWLSDDLTNPDKYAFPDTAVLGPFGFVRVWCDNDPEQGPYHADFRLSASGEEIGLFGPEIAGFPVIDSVTYGVQLPDTSLGRCPNGGDDWQIYCLEPCAFEPTPGTYNFCPIGVEDPLPAPPRMLSFGPVAPNPFHARLRGTLVIPLALPDRLHVEVFVYDVSGRAVARIADRVYDAGLHRITWDGTGIRTSELGSGIYFMRLRAGGEERTAKVVILR
jgi:hypothetical protein